MTEAAWYYAIDGRQRGPVDETTLRALAAQGVLRREDLIWTDGMVDWAAAGTMPWLFGAVPPVGSAPAHPAAPAWAQPTQPAPGQPVPWPAAAPESPYAHAPSPASPYAQQPTLASPYAQQSTAPPGPVVPLAYYAPGHEI